MKVCVIQPYYSLNPADTDRCYRDMVALLDQCDDSLDLIVLPEYSDIPAAQADRDGFRAADDPAEARRYLDMGIDCILTNDYLTVKTEFSSSCCRA